MRRTPWSRWRRQPRRRPGSPRTRPRDPQPARRRWPRRGRRRRPPFRRSVVSTWVSLERLGLGGRRLGGLRDERVGDRIGFDGRGDGGRSGRRGQVAEIVERRRLGQALRHGGELGRILFGEQALEEGGHLVLEQGDVVLDALDALLDARGVLLDLELERGLAIDDLLIGLLADARDLRLRPFADRRDVRVGGVAQLLGLAGGARVDRLDVRLRVGLETREGLFARRLGRGLHGLRQVGHQPVRLARRGGLDRGRRRPPRGATDRTARGTGRRRLGSRSPGGSLPRAWLAPRSPLSIFSDGLVGRGGLAGRVGLGPVGAPRELESRPGVGRGHASGSSVGSGRIGDVQGVAACCQPWMVWWSPLEVPAVGPGGTAAPPRRSSGAGRHRDEPGRRD